MSSPIKQALLDRMQQRKQANQLPTAVSDLQNSFGTDLQNNFNKQLQGYQDQLNAFGNELGRAEDLLQVAEPSGYSPAVTGAGIGAGIGAAGSKDVLNGFANRPIGKGVGSNLKWLGKGLGKSLAGGYKTLGGALIGSILGERLQAHAADAQQNALIRQEALRALSQHAGGRLFQPVNFGGPAQAAPMAQAPAPPTPPTPPPAMASKSGEAYDPTGRGNAINLSYALGTGGGLGGLAAGMSRDLNQFDSKAYRSF